MRFMVGAIDSIASVGGSVNRPYLSPMVGNEISAISFPADIEDEFLDLISAVRA